MRSTKRTRIRRIFIGVALAIIVAMATFAWTARDIYTYSHQRSKGNADAAIVLGAAAWNGTPSPVFQERINHAIGLYHEHRVKKILFTGGVDDGSSMAESDAAKRYAIDHGVPGRDIIIEDHSKTTFENLTNARAVARHDGLKTFLLVSDPLHMRRAMDMASDLHIDAEPSPTDTSRYVTRKTKREFLWRETWFLLEYRYYMRLVPQRSA